MPRGLDDLADIEAVFGALANASRRQILLVLVARGGRVTAGDIAARFECSWPTTSRHLKVLLEAGLVQVEREGREWFYVLQAERMKRVAGGWLQWFEPREGQNAETGNRVRSLSSARGQGRGAA